MTTGLPVAYLVDGVRTPFGRYAGALSTVRPDDLAASVVRSVVGRARGLDPADIDDVVLGCANQAGEDNRDVARMAVLLASLPVTVPGTTVNRLCGSGADAVSVAARSIVAGQADIVVAGGVESMSRAPFVMLKPDRAFGRSVEIHDTTIGWRFANPAIAAAHGTDAMGETAENVAVEDGVSRRDQDAFALRSQQRAAASRHIHAEEIVPVTVTGRTGDTVVDLDEHPRETSAEALARLRPAFREDGSVTAGNSAGINDGAVALLLASAAAVARHGWQPLARVTAAATVGVPPRTMGLGPVPATEKLLARTGIRVADLDVVEVNEAFAAQVLAVLRRLGLPGDADHVNPHGGAIALGHPLGASGARLILAAAREMQRRQGRRAVATMCIGVGQGIAVLLENP